MKASRTVPMASAKIKGKDDEEMVIYDNKRSAFKTKSIPLGPQSDDKTDPDSALMAHAYLFAAMADLHFGNEAAALEKINKVAVWLGMPAYVPGTDPWKCYFEICDCLGKMGFQLNPIKEVD